MKIMVFKRAEGISYFTPCAPHLEGESDASYYSRIQARLRKAGTYKDDEPLVAIIEHTELPQHHGFRNALIWDGEIKADMEKCRVIHRERMRCAREPLLAALDIQQLRGMDVEAEKQVLRDVTSDPAIDLAETPEELKAVWPEALKNAESR